MLHRKTLLLALSLLCAVKSPAALSDYAPALIYVQFDDALSFEQASELITSLGFGIYNDSRNRPPMPTQLFLVSVPCGHEFTWVRAFGKMQHVVYVEREQLNHADGGSQDDQAALASTLCRDFPDVAALHRNSGTLWLPAVRHGNARYNVTLKAPFDVSDFEKVGTSRDDCTDSAGTIDFDQDGTLLRIPHIVVDGRDCYAATLKGPFDILEAQRL